MKISTGLRPRKHAPVTHPQMGHEHSFVMDDAPMQMPAFRTMQTWLVTFETVADTANRPQGTIMGAHLYASDPKIEYKKVELDLSDELPKDYADRELAYVFREYNIPEDVHRTETPLPFHQGRHIKFEWYEVTA